MIFPSDASKKEIKKSTEQEEETEQNSHARYALFTPLLTLAAGAYGLGERLCVWHVGPEEWRR
jgi:hypothetical protein